MPWDYTEKAYEKQRAADPQWRLERLLTYEDGKEKLDPEFLKTWLPKLRIPDDRRAFLELLLWNKKF